MSSEGEKPILGQNTYFKKKKVFVWFRVDYYRS